MRKTILFMIWVFTSLSAQTPLTNTFTYQGELKFNNTLADGAFDFEFNVFDVETGGTVLETVLVEDVIVTNGVFTTPITLTNDLFTGNKIWLDIGVREGISTGAFDVLSPRQEVTSAPYAIHAQFVDLNNIPSWNIGGNSTSAGDFIGTLNTQPFIVRVNNLPVINIQDNTDGFNHTPNMIMGSSSNVMSGTNYGSTISGGALNNISNIYAVIAGGGINNVSGSGSTISGGVNNTVSGSFSTVPGGDKNQADGSYSFASGRRAIVRSSDQGTFIWADSTNADYTSSGSNQFLVRASGGMVLTDNSADNHPFSAQLFIDGSRNPIQARISGVTKFKVHSNGGVSIGDNGTPPANGLRVSGNITKGGGSFKIDHPLDPEHKYLSHSFVESPDMMNVYNGNIITDESGEAWVELPDWFEALNRDFRYQLTVIGSFSRAMIAKKIVDNKFLIKTEEPNIEVSWQITGIRHDHFANKNRIPVEELKPKGEVGTYLHPAAWGVSDKAKWLTTVTENLKEVTYE